MDLFLSSSNIRYSCHWNRRYTPHQDQTLISSHSEEHDVVIHSAKFFFFFFYCYDYFSSLNYVDGALSNGHICKPELNNGYQTSSMWFIDTIFYEWKRKIEEKTKNDTTTSTTSTTTIIDEMNERIPNKFYRMRNICARICWRSACAFALKTKPNQTKQTITDSDIAEQ